MYEYTSEVFTVGLAGLAQTDNDKISAIAAEGWEPILMTTVHNGFATLVLFRRESQHRRRVAPAKAAPATNAAAAKASPAKRPAARARAAAPVRKSRGR